MITEEKFPILEFDDNKLAKINPISMKEDSFNTNKLIITFFGEVVKELLNENKLVLERIIKGERPLEVYRFKNSDVLLIHGYVGCPACAGDLDLLNSMGITKVMFCGGGGVLDRNIKVGQILVVDGAIRDEGFSYHYIAPSRYIYTNPEVAERIVQYLDENSISYMRGITWTTDAIFRETNDRIEKRKSEGAKIVEMEQSGCIAVAQFRGFDYGALIYGGDDVSGEEWDNRVWRSRKGIRYDLVMLCKKLVEVI